MVIAKEEIFEWEPEIRDVDQKRILKSNNKPIDAVQEKQELKKAFQKKLVDLIKVKENLAHVIIVNMLILVGSIAVISICIVIGRLLMDSFLIFSVLFMILLFVMFEVFRLVDKETNCKNSR
ncbi:MAG: hypothetical protein ACFFC1_03355 [Promethearchaeota archaeon]